MTCLFSNKMIIFSRLVLFYYLYLTFLLLLCVQKVCNQFAGNSSTVPLSTKIAQARGKMLSRAPEPETTLFFNGFIPKLHQTPFRVPAFIIGIWRRNILVIATIRLNGTNRCSTPFNIVKLLEELHRYELGVL
jgi:hypothetical protein